MITVPAQISILSLAEYMVARVDRRAKLVAQAREKNEAAALRYSRARKELLRIFRGDHGRIEVELADAAESFRSRTPTGDWDAGDLQYSANAFDQLRTLLPDLQLGDRPLRHRRRWPRLHLDGVAITVSPDLIVRQMGAVPRVGGIKFRFGQSRQMEDEEGRYAATILRYYLLTQLKDESQKVAPRMCQVIDASTGQVFEARTAYKNDMKRVALACAEFRATWLAAELQQTPTERRLPPQARPS